MDQTPVRIGSSPVTTPEHMDVRAPYDDRLLGRVPACGPEHVDAAVAAAHDAMADPPPPWRRAEILDRASVLLAERIEALATIVSDEAAKPIRIARTEAERAVLTLRTSAEEARRLAGEVVPLDGAKPGDGKIGFTLRVPRGVVAAISPFNFPLNLVAHKLGPAFAAGCAVVLKPASQTPLSALALHDILSEAGLPDGWCNVVTGRGGSVGDPLVEHPDIAMVSFTGSPDVGWAITAKAARRKVGLELGNNSPVIIEPSGDWEAAASKVAAAGYAHAGQSCISTQRVYVHRSVHDEFVAALTGHVEDLIVGDPSEEATDLSTLIDPASTERVSGWIDEAVDGGAELAHGGGRRGPDDRILEPTVLVGVRPEMAVSRQEVFGPVVGVAAYDGLGEAIEASNATPYGLQAAIFTNQLDVALRAATELRFGGVLINEVPTFRSDPMPYGGTGDSGNTKEGPRYAVRDMTEERLVIIAR